MGDGRLIRILSWGKVERQAELSAATAERQSQATARSLQSEIEANRASEARGKRGDVLIDLIVHDFPFSLILHEAPLLGMMADGNDAPP